MLLAARTQSSLCAYCIIPCMHAAAGRGHDARSASNTPCWYLLTHGKNRRSSEMHGQIITEEHECMELNVQIIHT